MEMLVFVELRKIRNKSDVDRVSGLEKAERNGGTESGSWRQESNA